MKLNRLIFLFSCILALILQQSSLVFAEESSLINVKVTTDKHEYSESEEIKYLLTVSNLSDRQAKDIVITSTIPDSLNVTSQDSKVEGNKITWNIENMDKLSEVQLEFTAKVKADSTTPAPIETDVESSNGGGDGVQNQDSGAQNTLAPKTGDSTNFFGYIVLLIVSSFILIFVLRSLSNKKVARALSSILILALVLPTLSVLKVNAEEQRETASNIHKITINNQEYVVTTTVQATFDAVDQPNPAVNEVPVTGVAYLNDTELLAQSTLTFSSDGNETIEVETDSEGYFIVRLQPEITYQVTGEGLSSSITVTDTNNIQIDNTQGKISLGKTLSNGDNLSILQPSTIHFDENVTDQIVELADDLSRIVFEGSIQLNPGDVFLLPPLENYPTGLALKAVTVVTQGNQTIVTTAEPKLEEVFSAIKGDTSVELSPEYFTPAPGVEILNNNPTPVVQPRSLSSAALQARPSVESGIARMANLQSSLSDVTPMASQMAGVRALDDSLKLTLSLNDLIPSRSPIDFNGIVELEGDFTGEIDWAFEWDLVDSWDFRFTGSQVFKGEVVAGLDTEDVLPPKNIGNFRIPTQIPGLMVHLPVDLVLGAEGNVSIDITAGIKEDIGIEYSDGDGIDTYPEDKVQPVFSVSDLNGTGKASIGVKLSVLAEEAGIDIAGISGEGGIAGEAKSSIAGPSGIFACANMKSSLYAKFQLEAPIIDWSSSSNLTYEIDLAEKNLGSCVRSIKANPSSIEMAPGEVKSFTVSAKDGQSGIADVEMEDDISYRSSDSDIITVEKENNKVSVKAAANAQDGDEETIYITYKANGKEFKDEIEVTIIDNRERGSLVGKVIDAANSTPIEGAHVKIHNGNRLVTDVRTEADGTYKTDLVPGTYKVVVSYPNYITDTSNVTVNASNTTTFDSRLQIVGNEYGGIGNVSGTITNALTGQPVSGLTLTIRSGRNNTSGEVVQTLTTNEQGKYEVELPGGNYTLAMGGEGYITTSTNIIALGGLNKANQNATISPVGVLDDNIRVVLNWGQTPSDLDSHLTGPMAEGGRFHVYYSNESYSDSENEASLDVDITDSFGPETITVIKRLNEGTYTYAIHNYSDRGSSNLNLSNSNATVRIYSGNSLLGTYNVPINQEGNVWKVFEIRNGEIVPINRIDFTSSWQSASDFAPENQ